MRRGALRGQATIEFVLILPLLLVLVGIVCDVGVYMFEREQAASCVRTVARKASVRSATVMSLAEAPQCQKAADASALTLNPSTITPSSPAAGTSVTATIDYTYNPVFLDLAIPDWTPIGNLPIKASATMRMEAGS
jgi:Flp pilus assembly protein TadG